jgi:signal transduction histidine kinase
VHPRRDHGALTNAIKHVGPASAQVKVRYRLGALELEVIDDGAGDHANEAWNERSHPGRGSRV